ncbi:MAG: proline racemase family protein [Geminicoccaceae bacterium]|nr:proline racemase family protein [Geminicoccaceae bacterium]MCS7268611.1 proline racemase family protein [Geminicoccaceae bacterium]MDW8125340.1 proline racemase family protein [Geminicoccaceae bacterium]MDW8342617.1 proline racemase family protein [Geminicoccaceae bacterium]
MRWERCLMCVGVHAEGEIGRIVLGGLPAVPGGTMEERLLWLNENEEGRRLRRFLTSEPRGWPAMSTNLLLPPLAPGADAAFVVLQPDQAHAMSGSNAICTATALLELGMVPMREPETTIVLDTAAGLVRARVRCAEGRAREVTLDMPASFVEARGIELDVEGLGRIELAIAFGGVFYALVDPAPLGLAIEPEAAGALCSLGVRILEAARARFTPVHPERPTIRGLAYLMWCGEGAEGPRNATVLMPGRLDRSPCGTGSSARLALEFGLGRIRPGETRVFRSAIGTRFAAELVGTTEVAGRPAVLPRISGRAWLYSFEQLGLDPEDPFPRGLRLSDLWSGLAEP